MRILQFYRISERWGLTQPFVGSFSVLTYLNHSFVNVFVFHVPTSYRKYSRPVPTVYSWTILNYGTEQIRSMDIDCRIYNSFTRIEIFFSFSFEETHTLKAIIFVTWIREFFVSFFYDLVVLSVVLSDSKIKV